MNPELQRFVDRVVVPALLERFLRDHAVSARDSLAGDRLALSLDSPKPEATV